MEGGESPHREHVLHGEVEGDLEGDDGKEHQDDLAIAGGLLPGSGQPPGEDHPNEQVHEHSDHDADDDVPVRHRGGGCHAAVDGGLLVAEDEDDHAGDGVCEVLGRVARDAEKGRVHRGDVKADPDDGDPDKQEEHERHDLGDQGIFRHERRNFGEAHPGEDHRSDDVYGERGGQPLGEALSPWLAQAEERHGEYELADSKEGVFEHLEQHHALPP